MSSVPNITIPSPTIGHKVDSQASTSVVNFNTFLKGLEQNGNPVDHSATTPVVNFNALFEGLEQKVDIHNQPTLHRSLDPNIVYYLSDSTRSNYGVLEHLAWVSADSNIGEKISDEHLKKICSSYASRAITFNNKRGGKRKTRKARRSRK